LVTRGRRLLLADDSLTIQKVVDLTFSDEGIEVVAVSDGAQAVRRLEEGAPFDIVLADVFMPSPNGYELCERIKGDPRFRRTPVILLVGTFEPFNEAEARRVGADDVLTKPFQSIRDLVNKVGSLLGGGRAEEDEQDTGDLTPPSQTRASETQRQDAAHASSREAAHHASARADSTGDYAAHAATPAASSTRSEVSFDDIEMDDQMIEARPVEASPLDEAPMRGAASREMDASARQEESPSWRSTPELSAQGGMTAEWENLRRSAQPSSGAHDADSTMQATDEPTPTTMDTPTTPTATMQPPTMSATMPATMPPTRTTTTDDSLLDLEVFAPTPSAPAPNIDEDEFILDLDDEETSDARSASFSNTFDAAAHVAPQAVGTMGVQAPSEEAHAPSAQASTWFDPEADSATLDTQAASSQFETGGASARFDMSGEQFGTSADASSSLAEAAHGERETAYTGAWDDDDDMPTIIAEAPMLAAQGAATGFDAPAASASLDEMNATGAEHESAASPTGASETSPTVASGASTGGQISLEQLSPEVIDAIARRAVELLSARVVEQVAWEVVPDLAERLIKRQLEEEGRR
jgi:CheY-like chemotaxis protein